MNGINKTEIIETENCTIHICLDSIVDSKEEQEKIWSNFSESAYKLCTSIKQDVEN